MGLTVKVDTQAMLDVLAKGGVALDRVIESARKLDLHQSPLSQVPILIEIGQEVVTAVQYASQTGVLQSGQAAAGLVSQALDALFLFSGSVWGVVPLGSVLESCDGFIWDMLTKALYEAVRARAHQTGEMFEAAIAARFAR